MGMFDFLKPVDINSKINEYNKTNAAVLLDVRTVEEYRQGHIADSKNIPLDEIQKVGNMISDKNAAIFVYCLSGGRSSQAVSKLKSMGYTNVINSGGISSFKGKVEM